LTFFQITRPDSGHLGFRFVIFPSRIWYGTTPLPPSLTVSPPPAPTSYHGSYSYVCLLLFPSGLDRRSARFCIPSCLRVPFVVLNLRSRGMQSVNICPLRPAVALFFFFCCPVLFLTKLFLGPRFLLFMAPYFFLHIQPSPPLLQVVFIECRLLSSVTPSPFFLFFSRRGFVVVPRSHYAS